MENRGKHSGRRTSSVGQTSLSNHQSDPNDSVSRTEIDEQRAARADGERRRTFPHPVVVQQFGTDVRDRRRNDAGEENAAESVVVAPKREFRRTIDAAGSDVPFGPSKSSSTRKLDEKISFRFAKIDLHIDEALNTRDEHDPGQPFLHFILDSIVAKTKIKTFDMEFDATLADLIVFHDQFVGKDQRQLRLLSAELNNSSDQNEEKLVSVQFLHTSAENPLFKSATYDGIENRAHVHLSKLVVTLQLEALLSILRFQDALMKKLPKDLPIDENKTKKATTLKPPEDNRTLARSVSATNRVAKKTGSKREEKTNFDSFLRPDLSTTPTLKIQADLEEFRIVIASKLTTLFDIQVQGEEKNRKFSSNRRFLVFRRQSRCLAGDREDVDQFDSDGSARLRSVRRRSTSKSATPLFTLLRKIRFSLFADHFATRRRERIAARRFDAVRLSGRVRQAAGRRRLQRLRSVRQGEHHFPLQTHRRDFGKTPSRTFFPLAIRSFRRFWTR